MLFSPKPRIQEFEAAALPHLNDLYRTASRLLGDASRADDVLQDVYLQAWKSFDRFQPGTNCRAWLFKILFYSVHHYRRKWLNVRMVKEGEEILDHTAACAPVPEHFTDGRCWPHWLAYPRITAPWCCWWTWKSSRIRMRRES